MSGRLERAVPWVIALIALVARLIPGPRTIDDAYITFRYAQNLISGAGFVYNAGERVLGTTTPLYTLLMSLLSIPVGGASAPFPYLALVANAVLGAASCWLLIRLGSHLGYPIAGSITAVVWALAPMSVTFAIGGMETSLFVLLILATFYFYYSQRPTAGALMAALCLLTRPDGILFIGPLALERARQAWLTKHERTIPAFGWSEGMAFLLPLAAWTAFAGLYFGNPLPNSIAAKISAYHLPPNAALIRLLQHYATPFLGQLTFGNTWIPIGLVLFPFLFGLGALTVLRRRSDLWPIFAAPWIYLIVFSAFNPLIFRWYLAPPLPFYFLGIALGMERLGTDLRTRLVPLGMGLAAAILTLHGWVLHPSHGLDRPAPDMAYTKLELLYIEVADDLKQRLEPGQTVAAGDIGALGYYTGAHMLDTLGLVSPDASAYYPLDAAYYVINYAIPPKLISDLKPDYVVLLEVYGRKGLLQDEAFVRAYRLIETLPTDIYGSRDMFVFARAIDK
ncbi:MAG: hypothetical protein WBZ24_01780 [Anaerolineales bacterium]|jgi:hypothetical protein